MEKIKRVIIVLFFTVILILFLTGLQVFTGNAISITKSGLMQKNEMTKINVFPKIVIAEKIGDFIIKDKIGVEVLPGSRGTYKKVEFFRKGSSSVFEEFNLKCVGFSCRAKTIGYQELDIKWKTGTYIARVKDVQTEKYVSIEFKIESIF